MDDCIKRTVLTNTQKEILAAENEIQISTSQLDTFDPYWNEKQGNNVFLLTIALPQNRNANKEHINKL